MLLQERLEKIIKLTEDQSYSHAARMVEIKRLATEQLADLLKVELKAGSPAKKADKEGGSETGDTPKKSPPAASEKITF